MGATTIWERWDSMLPDGTVNPGEMTSFNHYALGAVADLLHRVVAGLARRRTRLPPAARASATGRRAHRGERDAAVPVRHRERPLASIGITPRRHVTVPTGSTASVELPGRDPVVLGRAGTSSTLTRRGAPWRRWPNRLHAAHRLPGPSRNPTRCRPDESRSFPTRLLTEAASVVVSPPRGRSGAAPSDRGRRGARRTRAGHGRQRIVEQLVTRTGGNGSAAPTIRRGNVAIVSACDRATVSS